MSHDMLLILFVHFWRKFEILRNEKNIPNEMMGSAVGRG